MALAKNNTLANNTVTATEKSKNIRPDVCTPPTNRGVLPTSGITDGVILQTGLAFSSRVVLDWVTCTFDYSVVKMAVITGEFGGMDERDRGMMGYSKSGSILGSGSFCWSPQREHQKMCLVLPASALAMLKCTAVELLEWLSAQNATFTRIDMAIDDFNQVLDLATIKEHLENGWLSSRWRTFRTDGDRLIGNGGLEAETTIYIGSRTSDSFTRIYDKVVEQQAKGLTPECDQWIRVELESKRDRANEIVQRILTAPSPCIWISSYLNGLIEFKEPQAGDNNKWRWPTSPWWSKFLGSVDKDRLSLPKKERTIESTKKWLWDNVAPNLAMVVGAGEYPAVIDMMTNGADRWSAIHKTALGKSNLSEDIARATLKALSRSQNFGASL